MLARDTVRVYAEAAARKKIALDVVVSPQVSLDFCTDARRVGQILTALVDNAVKHTHNGRVVVDVQTRASSTDICIDVVDDGIGMTQQQTEKIFVAFSQLEPPLTRVHGGIGLGLFFARELAQLLGGDLELVDSALGKGSRFRVTLVSSRPSSPRSPAHSLS
jgi:signal transduction histidine kinase